VYCRSKQGKCKRKRKETSKVLSAAECDARKWFCKASKVCTANVCWATARVRNIKSKVK